MKISAKNPGKHKMVNKLGWVQMLYIIIRMFTTMPHLEDV